MRNVVITGCPRADLSEVGALAAFGELLATALHHRGVRGLVTTKRGELESKDQLKRRIEDAARFVDPDQLCLSPQCGFSSTKEGNDLTQRQQWVKLRLIVETAQEAWGTW